MRLDDDAGALGFGDADPRLLQARCRHLAGQHRLHPLAVGAVVGDLDLVALDEAFHHLQHGEVRAVVLADRDRHVLQLLRLVDAGFRVDHDGEARHRRAKRHDLGGAQGLVLDRLHRALHDAPFAHAELIAFCLVIARLQAALEDVVLQRPVVGVVLPRAGRDHDVDVETFVAEEALVAGDQERQVVHRIHHRGFDFPEFSHGHAPSLNDLVFPRGIGAGAVAAILPGVGGSVNLGRGGQSVRHGEQVFNRVFVRHHLLVKGKLRDRLQRLAVRLDAERERIADHLGVDGRCLVPRCRLVALQVLEIFRLGPLERASQLIGDPGHLLEHRILHHQAVVDRIDACPPEPVERGVLRVGDERLDLRRLDADVAQRGVNYAVQQQVPHLLAAVAIIDVRRLLEVQDMLVVGRDEGDLVQVDAVFALQHAARPQPGGDGVAAVDADLAALQVLRPAEAGADVLEDRPVVEIPRHEHRNGGERQTGGAGADIGGERHLADIEFQPSAHPPHHRHDLVDLDEFQIEPSKIGTCLLHGLGQAVIPQCYRQRLHRRIPPWLRETIACPRRIRHGSAGGAWKARLGRQVLVLAKPTTAGRIWATKMTWLRAFGRFFEQKIGLHRLGVLLSICIIAVAAVVLYRKLHNINVSKVLTAMATVEYKDVAISALFVALGYFTLTFYDLFALRTIGRGDVPYRIAALGGFTSYSD